jgi:hypothetical protein
MSHETLHDHSVSRGSWDSCQVQTYFMVILSQLKLLYGDSWTSKKLIYGDP